MAKKKKFYKVEPWPPEPPTKEEMAAYYHFPNKQDFFERAPALLKTQIKYFIQHVDYVIAGELASHIAECHKGTRFRDYTYDRKCLQELIDHWRT